MLFQSFRNRGAVRTEQYRLSVNNTRSKEPLRLDGHVVELHDIHTDPGQKTDLSKANPQVTRQLFDAWRRFLEVTDAEPPAKLHPPIPVGHADRRREILPAMEVMDDARFQWSSRHHNNAWITDALSNALTPAWEIEALNAGRYAVRLEYTCTEAAVGAKIEARVAGQSLRKQVDAAYDPPLTPSPDREPRVETYEKPWATMDLGAVRLEQGVQHIAIWTAHDTARTGLDINAIHIERLD
jgi:hypothetical protein